jgi:hypothetical protein
MLKLEARGLFRVTSTSCNVEEFRRVTQNLLNLYGHRTKTLSNGHLLHTMLEIEDKEFQINAVSEPRPYHKQQFVIARKPRKKYTKKVKPVAEVVAEKIIEEFAGQ